MINALNTLKKEICKTLPIPLINNEEWDTFRKNTTVALMAGGDSSRFKSVPGSENTNKNSFKLPNDDTMIEMTIRMYRDAGITDFVALVYHQAETIENLLGDGTSIGVKIKYSHDPERPVDKGGAILNAIKNGSIDQNKNLIVHNPDDVILNSTKEFPRLIASGHINGTRQGGELTVVIVTETPYSYTGMSIDQNRVTNIEQYPLIPVPTHIGVTIFSPRALKRLFADFNAIEKFNYETELFPVLANEQKLFSVSIPIDDWLAVNNLKAYTTLLKRLGLQ
ncbi:MAG: transferase protein [Patescibacteria group bacterium]|nr:transferase protein [Patescibacteria group bacterium]